MSAPHDNGAYDKPTWADPICESLANTAHAYAHNSLRIEGFEVVVYGYDREVRDVRFVGKSLGECEAFVAGARDVAMVTCGWVWRAQDRSNAR